MQESPGISTTAMQGCMRRHLRTEACDAMNLVALDAITMEELATIDDDLHEDPCAGSGYIAVDDL